MLSNSQTLFSEMSTALYRAGMFISHADLTGGEKALKVEIQALNFMMQLLQRQHSETSFIHELAKLAAGDIEDFADLETLSDDDLASICSDPEKTPDEIEHVVKVALENFSKSEARLYTDILISTGASVAQAYDERDDFFLTGDEFVDRVTFLGNLRPFFQRILMLFNDFHVGKNAKYLYESNNVFDEMRISTRESDALAKITGAVRRAWEEKYPEDFQQSVKDYIQNNQQT